MALLPGGVGLVPGGVVLLPGGFVLFPGRLVLWPGREMLLAEVLAVLLLACKVERTLCSFAKNGKERKNVLFFCKRTRERSVLFSIYI